MCLTTTYCESGDLAKIVKHASKTKSLLGEKTVLGWFVQVRNALCGAPDQVERCCLDRPSQHEAGFTVAG